MTKLLNNINLLIVDDDATNRLLLTIYLIDSGMNITEAISGEDAINILNKNKNFDIILMDIRMPGLDGIEVSEFIKTKMKLNISIISMSASHNVDDLDKLYELGITSHILKPITRKKLISIIESKLK